jgi:thioredoxin 1
MKNIESYEHFKKVIASEKPIVVKFGAPWCAPCKAIEPNLQEVANTTDIEVYKLNIDDISEPAEDYGVMGIPATFVFANSQPLNKLVGIPTAEQIIALTKGV